MDRESKSIIENTLLRFIAESYEPAVRHQRVKQGEVNCLLHWRLLAELGVLGLPFEEAVGGLGGASVDVADAVTVLARGLILEPFIEAAVISGGVLALGRNPEQRGQAVAQAIEGASVTAMLGGRPGVPDKLSYRKTLEGYRLSGSLSLIPFAEQADFWLLAAVADDGAQAIFRVPRSETRASVAGYRLMDGRPAADIGFDDTTIPSSAAWLEGDAARGAIDLTCRRAVSAYCADAVGVMALLLEVTGEYLRTRVQFGVTIGRFRQYSTVTQICIWVSSRHRQLHSSLPAVSMPRLPRSKPGFVLPRPRWSSGQRDWLVRRPFRCTGHGGDRRTDRQSLQRKASGPDAADTRLGRPKRGLARRVE
ncbi:acyl-CoA dehydrogenase family protein [Paraburkholderia sp. PGU19]|uniref:acyl-CoA dehydrogenase family protein n=1 Tax=Paraburkholderia sp. PGU19 TaxID=2735434 RepID=UPI0015D9A1CD|nr:acyl-CoA dehydrogenase family protein [Paraburkholderia sp. PGU19]